MPKGISNAERRVQSAELRLNKYIKGNICPPNMKRASANLKKVAEADSFLKILFI